MYFSLWRISAKFTAFLVVFGAFARASALTSMDISTSYSSPAGSYDKIRTFGPNTLAQDGGNVGVWTHNPTMKLDVNGLVKINGPRMFFNRYDGPGGLSGNAWFKTTAPGTSGLFMALMGRSEGAAQGVLLAPGGHVGLHVSNTGNASVGSLVDPAWASPMGARRMGLMAANDAFITSKGQWASRLNTGGGKITTGLYFGNSSGIGQNLSPPGIPPGQRIQVLIILPQFPQIGIPNRTYFIIKTGTMPANSFSGNGLVFTSTSNGGVNLLADGISFHVGGFANYAGTTYHYVVMSR